MIYIIPEKKKQNHGWRGRFYMGKILTSGPGEPILWWTWQGNAIIYIPHVHSLEPMLAGFLAAHHTVNLPEGEIWAYKAKLCIMWIQVDTALYLLYFTYTVVFLDQLSFPVALYYDGYWVNQQQPTLSVTWFVLLDKWADHVYEYMPGVAGYLFVKPVVAEPVVASPVVARLLFKCVGCAAVITRLWRRAGIGGLWLESC